MVSELLDNTDPFTPCKSVPESKPLKNINANIKQANVRIVSPLLKKEGEEITNDPENEVFNAFFGCFSKKKG